VPAAPAAEPAGEVCAPVDEIEITPAMVEAGVSAFVRYDSRFVGPEEAVAEIHEAMVRAHQSSVLAGET
jgi:hypothetical protein